MIGEALPPHPPNLGWVNIKKDGVVLEWPLPAWSSFWHLDRFSFAWSRVVDRARGMKKQRRGSPDKLISWLAFQWIRFATDVLLSNRNELKDLSDDQGSMDTPWGTLIADLRFLLDNSEKEGDFQSQELVLKWIGEVRVMVSGNVVGINIENKDFETLRGLGLRLEKLTSDNSDEYKGVDLNS